MVKYYKRLCTNRALEKYPLRFFYNVKRIGDVNALDIFLNHGLYTTPNIKCRKSRQPFSFVKIGLKKRKRCAGCLNFLQFILEESTLEVNRVGHENI
jgi:hypothetical protein